MTTEPAGHTAPFFDEHFLRSWLWKEKLYLRRLADAPRGPAHEPDRAALVADAMAHQLAYFAAKCDLARRDAVLALSTPWLNPDARAGIWIGGWRPTAAVRLAISIAGSAVDVPEELRSEREMIRAEEERIDGEMERVQERAVAAVVDGWRRGCGAEAVKKSEREMAAGIESAVRAAEELRMEALRKVVELVGPAQAVDFLAAFTALQLGLHHADRM